VTGFGSAYFAEKKLQVINYNTTTKNSVALNAASSSQQKVVSALKEEIIPIVDEALKKVAVAQASADKAIVQAAQTQ
jgi:hypothetical protein